MLVAAYNQALKVAADAGARTVALPILGTGFNRWGFDVSVEAAIESLRSPFPGIDEARLVTDTQDKGSVLERLLVEDTPPRLLQGVRRLHQRGFAQCC